MLIHILLHPEWGSIPATRTVNPHPKMCGREMYSIVAFGLTCWWVCWKSHRQRAKDRCKHSFFPCMSDWHPMSHHQQDFPCIIDNWLTSNVTQPAQVFSPLLEWHDCVQTSCHLYWLLLLRWCFCVLSAMLHWSWTRPLHSKSGPLHSKSGKWHKSVQSIAQTFVVQHLLSDPRLSW